jgi:hypothetical protein
VVLCTTAELFILLIKFVTKMEFEDVDWNHLAQDRGQ